MKSTFEEFGFGRTALWQSDMACQYLPIALTEQEVEQLFLVAVTSASVKDDLICKLGNHLRQYWKG